MSNIKSTKIMMEVDSQTGEILSEKRDIHVISKNPVRPFVKMYTDESMMDLLKISRTELAVLLYMIREVSSSSTPSTRKVKFLKSDKDSIASVLGISKRSIDNAVTALLSSKLVLREGRATYRINPYYFSFDAANQAKTDAISIDDTIGRIL